MGILGKLLRVFKKRKRYRYGYVQLLLGKWKPYRGDSTLPRTHLPRTVHLPRQAAILGSPTGPLDFSDALFPYWLRLDPSRIGFLITQIRGGSMYLTHAIERPDKPPRIIHAPDALLKFVQRRILRRVLEQMTVHPAAHGFVKGRSIITNAALHVGQEMVIALDLRDFFPSISFRRVTGLFISHGFSPRAATTLAALCCYRGALPQGAPTSPMISNLVCARLDSRLAGLAAKHGAVYTRYADDLTLSGPVAIRSLLPLIRRIIREESFTVAREKVRIYRRGTRQLVTGLVVNDRVSVPRRVRRYLRAMVHNEARSAQPDAAMVRFLRGHISFMRPIHPALSERLANTLEGVRL